MINFNTYYLGQNRMVSNEGRAQHTCREATAITLNQLVTASLTRVFVAIVVICYCIETVAFKIPNLPIDRSIERFFTHWDEDTRHFYLQLFFAAPTKTKEEQKLDEGEEQYEIAEGDEMQE